MDKNRYVYLTKLLSAICCGVCFVCSAVMVMADVRDTEVKQLYFTIDESKGTIEAMNSDPKHDTYCYGTVSIDGKSKYYVCMKGRGNSTWKFEKKPYNFTIYDDDYKKRKKQRKSYHKKDFIVAILI